MSNEQISTMDLVVEVHKGLKRQGPGSAEMTIKALGFLDNRDSVSKIADLGCGTGAQTIVLAQNMPHSTVIGLDQFSAFTDILNSNAGELNLDSRVSGIVGSMENLPFGKDEFDLIWSEGAIDGIGFENGLTHWHGFLKKGGHVAVTSPSWLSDEHPAEVEKFWADAGSGLDTVGHSIALLQKAGYHFVAAFALPEECWTENYFAPRETAEKLISEKYAGNKTVEEYLAGDQYEVDLYAKYKQCYGYVFYIGKKV